MSELLTAEKILAGAVDVRKVTGEQLVAFVEKNELGIDMTGTKADVLNRIAEELEARSPAAPGADVEVDVEEAEEAEEAVAPQVAGVVGDVEVNGSNYLKRRAAAIAAGRKELGGIPSNLEDEAKKSSYIARRFKGKL